MMDPFAILDSTMFAVAESIQGGVYPPGRRTQLEVAYCHLVFDHHCAISILLEAKSYASALALARPTFEALVKGLWLYHCASDEQLERHAGGKELDQIAELITPLQSAPIPPVVAKSLAQIKVKYWKTLSSLTHVGHAQLRHWIDPSTGVQSKYPEQALLELANFASFMLLVAGRELTLRANNRGASERLANLLPNDMTPNE